MVNVLVVFAVVCGFNFGSNLVYLFLPHEAHKSKDWMARNQDINVSAWSDMSVHPWTVASVS